MRVLSPPGVGDIWGLFQTLHCSAWPPLPSLVWSDNGTNFTGAARELYQFLQTQSTQQRRNSSLAHFGGIWEATVKSSFGWSKTNLWRETTPSSRSISLLKRWQSLLWHFWNRWSSEYVTQIRRFTKWRHHIETAIWFSNAPIPTKWPLHPGKDNLVRVAIVRTRPVTKLALLLPNDDWCTLFSPLGLGRRYVGIHVISYYVMFTL